MTEKKTRFAGIAQNRAKLPDLPPEIVETPAPVVMPLKFGRPPGKKTNPSFSQVTVYLRKETHQAARKLLIDEHRNSASWLKSWSVNG